MEEELEDVISCQREDEHVLAEVAGISGDIDYCSPHEDAGDDIDDYGPDFISAVKNAPAYEHRTKTWLIGPIKAPSSTRSASRGRG